MLYIQMKGPGLHAAAAGARQRGAVRPPSLEICSISWGHFEWTGSRTVVVTPLLVALSAVIVFLRPSLGPARPHVEPIHILPNRKRKEDQKRRKWTPGRATESTSLARGRERGGEQSYAHVAVAGRGWFKPLALFLADTYQVTSDTNR